MQPVRNSASIQDHLEGTGSNVNVALAPTSLHESANNAGFMQPAEYGLGADRHKISPLWLGSIGPFESLNYYFLQAH